MKFERLALLSLLLIVFCAAARQVESRPEVYALRLQPGQDLRREIERFAKDNRLQAGFIVTCVGSLDRTTLRLANQQQTTQFAGHMEIVSLVGTLSPDGVHLHLVEGCRIDTTA